MSDFPDLEQFSRKQSSKLFQTLQSWNTGTGSPNTPFILKKAKHQFLYDLDDNKYTDFYMNNGSALLGHNHGSLTQYIKNGLSTGSQTSFPDKFYYQLVRSLRQFAPGKSVSLYQSALNAYRTLVKKVLPSSIRTSSAFIRETLEAALTHSTTILSWNEEPGIETDLLIYEPLDFDGNLADLNISERKAKFLTVDESRTAFRFHFGLKAEIDSSDFIICGDVLLNGIESAVIFSKTSLTGEYLPAYKSLGILETLRLYEHMIPNGLPELCLDPDKIAFTRKSLFKLKTALPEEIFLRNGVFLKGTIGFTALPHTVHDFSRLTKALSC